MFSLIPPFVTDSGVCSFRCVRCHALLLILVCSPLSNPVASRCKILRSGPHYAKDFSATDQRQEILSPLIQQAPTTMEDNFHLRLMRHLYRFPDLMLNKPLLSMDFATGISYLAFPNNPKSGKPIIILNKSYFVSFVLELDWSWDRGHLSLIHFLRTEVTKSFVCGSFELLLLVNMVSLSQRTKVCRYLSIVVVIVLNRIRGLSNQTKSLKSETSQALLSCLSSSLLKRKRFHLNVGRRGSYRSELFSTRTRTSIRSIPFNPKYLSETELKTMIVSNHFRIVPILLSTDSMCLEVGLVMTTPIQRQSEASTCIMAASKTYRKLSRTRVMPILLVIVSTFLKFHLSKTLKVHFKSKSTTTTVCFKTTDKFHIDLNWILQDSQDLKLCVTSIFTFYVVCCTNLLVEVVPRLCTLFD